MKTFALVLYLIAADGRDDRFVLDSGLTARDCAHRLTLAVTIQSRDAERFAVVACEEEQEV